VLELVLFPSLWFAIPTTVGDGLWSSNQRFMGRNARHSMDTPQPLHNPTSSTELSMVF
jgi:hypothetical protein